MYLHIPSHWLASHDQFPKPQNITPQTLNLKPQTSTSNMSDIKHQTCTVQQTLIAGSLQYLTAAQHSSFKLKLNLKRQPSTNIGRQYDG